MKRIEEVPKVAPEISLAELEQKFRAVPESKVEALKSLAPEVHDLVATLGKILALKPEKKRSRRTGERRG